MLNDCCSKLFEVFEESLFAISPEASQSEQKLLESQSQEYEDKCNCRDSITLGATLQMVEAKETDIEGVRVQVFTTANFQGSYTFSKIKFQYFSSTFKINSYAILF